MSAKVGQIGNVRGAMFVGGSYSHRSTSVDAEKTLNKYPEYMESLSKCDLALFSFPFGGTNSTIDALILGLPMVSMLGKEPHAMSDAARCPRNT